jgi:urease accessory protein
VSAPIVTAGATGTPTGSVTTVWSASHRPTSSQAGWTGTTRLERASRPLLHTTVGLGPGEPAWLPPMAPRAYASTMHIADDEAAVATGKDAVRLPLPGGWVTTAWGAELHRVVRRVQQLDPRATEQVPA